MPARPSIPENVEHNLPALIAASCRQGSMYRFPGKATTASMHDWMARATKVYGLWARHEIAMASECSLLVNSVFKTWNTDTQGFPTTAASCLLRQMLCREPCACPILVSRMTSDSNSSMEAARACALYSKALIQRK